MSNTKYPKGEKVWVSYYDTTHTLRFIMTTKDKFREFYFLYELVDGEFKKLGRAKSPTELERKFNINKIIKGG